MLVRAREIGFLAFTALSACGGKVVVDGVGAGGGSSTTSTASTSASTTSTTVTGAGGGSSVCGTLLQDFQTKLDVARTCTPGIDLPQCTGASVLADTCDCQVVGGGLSSEAAIASQLAHDAWVAAGCGPFDCESCPPPPSTPWYCDDATSRCTPLVVN